MVEEPTLSPSSIRHIISMVMQLVTSGRHIIFYFLTELGLQLGDKIEEQGWSNFHSLNVLTYPNLVWSFYEHLIMEEEHVESIVKGKRIIITEESLGSLLQMPTVGNKYLKLNYRSSALRTVFERKNTEEIGSVTISSLSLEMRLLHNFISRIFIP